MSDPNLETIKKIAEILAKYEEDRSYIELMAVYDGVKPGFLAQSDKMIEVLIPYLPALGMFYSKKHEGFVTKNKDLFESWEGLVYYWHDKIKKDFGSFYLGYPKCCVEQYNESPGEIQSLYYFFFTQKALKDGSISKTMKEYFQMVTYLPSYRPCKLSCKESEELSGKMRKIVDKYGPYLKMNYEKENYESRKAGFADSLDLWRNKHAIKAQRKEILPGLEKWQRHNHVEEEFKSFARNFFANPEAYKEILQTCIDYIKKL